MSIKNALQELLNNLDKVKDKYPQIRDTAVREDLHATIIDYFVFDPSSGGFPLNQLSKDFSMLRPKGDEMIHKALLQFLTHPDVIEARVQLTTPQERLDAFQDHEVQSSNGNSYDRYFGWSERLPPR